MFSCKNSNIEFWSNSWPIGSRSIFGQNLPQLLFLFQFFSLTTKYAIWKFWWKNADIVFQSKFLTSRTKGHFRTNFTRIIYLFIFHFYRIFQLFLRPLNILSTSFRAKMETLHSGRNSWPIGTRGIFLQNLPQLVFLSKEFSIFFFDH